MIMKSNNIYVPEGMLINTIENREYLTSLQSLENAMNCGKILESTAIMCDENSTLHIDLLNGIRGYISREESMYCRNGEQIKDIAVITRVGKPVCFKILRIGKDENGYYAILSRREAQKDCVINYLSGLVCGDIIPAKVTHIENFGAFVDIGCGISSLLSIDCISVSRISHPSDRLHIGMNIYAVIKNIEESSGRIYISTRELLGTWEENSTRFKVGSTVAGIIRSVESYGIFVELAPNLAGLAEIRDSSSCLLSPEKIIGCRAAVYIKSIIPERMKIKLVLINISGKAEKNADLGYFIDPSQKKHIDRWVYSPSVSMKTIESVFDF